jgi:PAS domain S-box-containing protein
MSRVLIADDDRTSCKLLGGLLTKWGYQVGVAHTGDEALRELLQPNAPQLAILDWVMPGLNGIQVVKSLRAAHLVFPPYVLLLTSKTEKEHLLEGLEAGADDYLKKPFDAHELRARLRVGAERKRMEAELREAERKYRGLFNDAIVGIFQSTVAGRLLSVNPAMARIFGYDSPEEMLAAVTSISQQLYVKPNRRGDFVLALEKFGVVKDFECEVFRKDGSKIWTSASAQAVRENGVAVRYEGMVQDITERKSAERSLNLLRLLIDQSNDSIEVMDPETKRFVDFNERACLNLGYSREELVGRSLFDINPNINETTLRPITEQLRASGSAMFQTLYRRKDGSTFPVELSIKRVQLERTYDLCVARDVTERQQAQQQLLQAQKLESIGQLAAGIAHEINTPTQYIGDNVRFLKDAFQDLTGLLAGYERLWEAAKGNCLSPDTVQAVTAAVEGADVAYLREEIPKAIDQTLEGVTRVSTIVRAMKDFSHPGAKDKTPLDINRAIESTLTVARNEWKYVADLETDFDSSLPLVSCLPGEINQVILNLIVNSAHAIADVTRNGTTKGKIRVQTLNGPEWIEIRIQDNGSGIPEKVRTRIFDPFFTTKEVGKGTGQGLAIARSVVVDKHGGSIQFETEEGKGTTFIVRLPHEGKALAATAVSA